MSIGSRIKERRTELNLTQPELAKLLNVSKGTVGNYECDISAPNEKILFKLFEVLKCDANYLYQDNISVTTSDMMSSADKIFLKKYKSLDNHGKKIVNLVLDEEYERCIQPVEEETAPKPTLLIKHSIYKVSAGLGFDLGDGDSWEEIEIPDTRDTRRADFALTIKGDSMTPTFQDGDIVLVKQQDSIDVGQIGVFVLNGAGYIKKLGENRLISINDDYDDILLTEYDELFCAGKVIGRI